MNTDRKDPRRERLVKALEKFMGGCRKLTELEDLGSAEDYARRIADCLDGAAGVMTEHALVLRRLLVAGNYTEAGISILCEHMMKPVHALLEDIGDLNELGMKMETRKN